MHHEQSKGNAPIVMSEAVCSQSRKEHQGTKDGAVEAALQSYLPAVSPSVANRCDLLLILGAERVEGSEPDLQFSAC